MQHRSSLNEMVVVITGASSGIGRATAHAFAAEGATVVLAARSEAGLEAARRECEGLGGRALVVPTDVADQAQVDALAAAARPAGGIDVWVNNAGVMQVGRFEDTAPEIFRQVIETNFLGVVHGARAALRSFRAAGSGVLINVASVVAESGQPLSAAYVASKSAIRGFSMALRQELTDAPDIHVCTVLPGAVDTPLFEHAANQVGRPIRAPRPTNDPYQVARAIRDLALRPRPEIHVGAGGRLPALQHGLAPGLAERAAAALLGRGLFGAGAVPRSEGNLFRPTPPAAVEGGWRERRAGRNAPAGIGTGMGALALLAVPIGFVAARRLAAQG